MTNYRKKQTKKQNKKKSIQKGGTEPIAKFADGFPCKDNEECISNICKNNMIGQGKCSSLSNTDDIKREISKFADTMTNTVSNIGSAAVNTVIPLPDGEPEVLPDEVPKLVPNVVGGRRRKKSIKKTKKQSITRMIGGKKRKIHTGPRGGRFFISNGRKLYI